MQPFAMPPYISAIRIPVCRFVQCLGSPVVPFYPFSCWVPVLKPDSRKKGTLIIKGLLGNLGVRSPQAPDPGASPSLCIEMLKKAPMKLEPRTPRLYSGVMGL